MRERSGWLRDWVEQVESASGLKVTDSTLTKSKRWSLSEGEIKHDSGRFFSVVGIRWTAPNGDRVSQPLFKQEEQGILGFIIRRLDDANEILAYAKIEPGNVDTVQLAPTCQATRGNISRVHGGELPPFADFFEHTASKFLYDVPQSEQGTRFYGKQNRNVLVAVERDLAHQLTHRWLPVEEMLELLEVDFAINTDARSVLISSPWEMLTGRVPFSRYGTGFGKELARSARENGDAAWYEKLSAWMDRVRKKTEKPVITSLDEIDGWRVTESGVEPESEGPFMIHQIEVRARDREVTHWDQPIVDSTNEGAIDLLCGRADGTLRFLLRPYAEPGLYNLVQLGPTLVMEPGATNRSEHRIDTNGAHVVLECKQSEEGGRFFRDVNNFRIIDVEETFEPPEGWHWLTLAQIRRLLDESGWLTNEARSALALLLKWL